MILTFFNGVGHEVYIIDSCKHDRDHNVFFVIFLFFYQEKENTSEARKLALVRYKNRANLRGWANIQALRRY